LGQDKRGPAAEKKINSTGVTERQTGMPVAVRDQLAGRDFGKLVEELI